MGRQSRRKWENRRRIQEKVKPTIKVERILQLPGAIQAETRLEDPSVLIELDKDKSKVHAIVLAIRPGANMFGTWLEHEHFNPLTDREPLLEYRHIYWMDEAFILMTIPFQDWQLIHKAAEVAKLRVSNGVPTVIDGNGVHHFPMQSQRICSLENHKIPFHFGSRQHKVALEMEDKECDEIRKKTNEQFNIKIRDNN